MPEPQDNHEWTRIDTNRKKPIGPFLQGWFSSVIGSIRVHSCPFVVVAFLASVTTQAIDGPLTPEESLKYLKTEPGLKVELVAAE
ncbi:MAG: hypothetical protein QOJ40_1084, partial [Verrucomicrobiota bacterium]